MHGIEHAHWSLNVEGLALLVRALALRKLHRIGTLWVESDRVWVSENECDPYGSRVRVSMETLRGMVEDGERIVSKTPQAEISVESAKKTFAG